VSLLRVLSKAGFQNGFRHIVLNKTPSGKNFGVFQRDMKERASFEDRTHG
jgi:hypothetical protein